MKSVLEETISGSRTYKISRLEADDNMGTMPGTRARLNSS